MNYYIYDEYVSFGHIHIYLYNKRGIKKIIPPHFMFTLRGCESRKR